MAVRFATEERLVDQFEQLFRVPGTERWRWLRELDTADGTVDLVAVRLIQEVASHGSLAKVPSKWAYALHRLPTNEPFTPDHLAALANISRSSARSVLGSFCAAGFCESVSRTSWVKVGQPTPIAKRIVTVEAKLRDWRRALYQATQHTNYASQSWVVLDHAYLSFARLHIDDFAFRGVGLAALSTTGDLEIVVRPADNIPRMATRFWQANAEIARRLSGPLP